MPYNIINEQPIKNITELGNVIGQNYKHNNLLFRGHDKIIKENVLPTLYRELYGEKNIKKYRKKNSNFFKKAEVLSNYLLINKFDEKSNEYQAKRIFNVRNKNIKQMSASEMLQQSGVSSFLLDVSMSHINGLFFACNQIDRFTGKNNKDEEHCELLIFDLSKLKIKAPDFTAENFIKKSINENFNDLFLWDSMNSPSIQEYWGDTKIMDAGANTQNSKYIWGSYKSFCSLNYDKIIIDGEHKKTILIELKNDFEKEEHLMYPHDLVYRIAQEILCKNNPDIENDRLPIIKTKNKKTISTPLIFVAPDVPPQDMECVLSCHIPTLKHTTKECFVNCDWASAIEFSKNLQELIQSTTPELKLSNEMKKVINEIMMILNIGCLSAMKMDQVEISELLFETILNLKQLNGYERPLTAYDFIVEILMNSEEKIMKAYNITSIEEVNEKSNAEIIRVYREHGMDEDGNIINQYNRMRWPLLKTFSESKNLQSYFKNYKIEGPIQKIIHKYIKKETKGNLEPLEIYKLIKEADKTDRQQLLKNEKSKT